MNIQLPQPVDSSAFLAWAEGREGRYELVNGRVIMMTGATRGHALVVRGLARAFDNRLVATPWIALTSELRDLAAINPVLIAKVLSPSSVTTDLGDKAAEYLRLEGLAAYLVFSQDEPKAWAWLRGEVGFSAGPEAIAGKDGLVRISALSIVLPLSEIYEEFPASDS